MVAERVAWQDSWETETWDVIIIGGALTGAATALQLLKGNPGLKVAIVEANAAHKRRVGESTVEVSSYFLGRVLGLSGELNRNHISKQGLRFWFANEEVESFADCSEIGPKFNVLFPGYQIDRARLDEVVLAKAAERGAQLLRPAKAVGFELQEGALQRLEVEVEGRRRSLQTRWLVDASGVRAMIGRKQGWIHPNGKHPIATVWSRWKNVTDWDDESLYAESPRWSQRVVGTRNSATNHLVGKGWWAWWIPLQDGDVSIGVVYDQRLYELGDGPSLGERLAAHLRGHPMGERLLRNAEFIQGDVSFRRNIAYYSDRFAGDGFALVGDAAGFIDPFYSPGLDWVCYGVMATSKLICDSLESGRTCPEGLAKHNQSFSDSYHRWFSAIYQDKYFYMGDFELMKVAFRLDLGFYYLGAVRRPFVLGREFLTTPSFGQKEAAIPARIISFYNRRLAAIGRRRMASGRWGRRNARRNYSFFSYRLNWTLPLRLGVAIGAYLRLEIVEFFANLGSSPRQAETDKPAASEALP